jgi:hypothetical protein
MKITYRHDSSDSVFTQIKVQRSILTGLEFATKKSSKNQRNFLWQELGVHMYETLYWVLKLAQILVISYSN